MGLLQKLFIKTLNPFYSLTRHISDKVKHIILFLSFFILAIHYYAFPAWIVHGYSFSYKEAFIIGFCLLCIIIVFSIQEPLSLVSWNRIICIPWLLSGILILMSGLHHDIKGTFLTFSILIIFVFPCLIFVWNNRRDYDTLFSLISNSIVIASIVFTSFNFLLAPIQFGFPYTGIYGNPNSLGIASIPGIIASLYLLTITNSKLKIFYIIAFANSFCLAYFSTSRASMLAIILIFTIFVFCYFKSILSRNDTLLKTIATLAITITFCFLTFFVYSSFLADDTLYNCTIKGTPYPTDIIYYGNIDASSNIPTQDNNALQDTQSTEKSKLDSISSGRITIWTAYLKELNITGHDRNLGDLYIKSTGQTNAAHNTYIEVSYRSGIFAGICYALVALYAGFYAIRFILFKKYFDHKQLFIAMSIIAFGIMSNLEQAVFPFEKMHILMYITSLAPLFEKKDTQHSNNKDINYH